jgi:signal transduction histidine kinase
MNFSDSELEAVATHTQTLNLQPEDVIIHEGESGDDLFVIVDGKVSITKKGFSNDAIELGELRKGTVIGELAFIDKLPRSVTVAAKTSCKLIQINGTNFAQILGNHPALYPKFIDDVIMKFRKSNDNFYKKMLKKNQELKNAFNELKTLDEQKSKFVGLASHEVKTPLAIMMGNLDLLHQGILGDLPEKISPVIKKICERSKQLSKIIQQIIDVSTDNKIETTLIKESVNLKEVTTDVCDEVSLLMTQRKLDLSNLVEFSGPIQADGMKIRQIIMNLLLNAIRFTADGGKIELGCLEKERTIQLFIKDTGIGIDASEQERVFSPFYMINKVEKHTSGITEFGSGGIGLGLTICKNFAEQHGGSVTVESTIGKGSTFTLILPK